jgi:uncharacterized protein (DUF2235 family)
MNSLSGIKTKSRFTIPAWVLSAFLAAHGKEIGIILGKAFGVGLTENIEDAYSYLMDRFEPEDTLYLFGFSRGAFAVRCLAGMLHKVGLPKRGSSNLIPYASKIYNTSRPLPRIDSYQAASLIL